MYLPGQDETPKLTTEGMMTYLPSQGSHTPQKVVWSNGGITITGRKPKKFSGKSVLVPLLYHEVARGET
jgi:hypothetical protein